MNDPQRALETLELALARASSLFEGEQVAAAGRIVERVRRRRGFFGETLVLAIGGGTGTGKSSLLNALAGARIARTGVLRPCTDRPLAWIPERPEPALIELLDRLGIDERVGHNRFPALSLIDLPDHDSVVTDHKAIVEELLPEVDGVVWVFEPQKYRDPLIHEAYLLPLVDLQDQFLFVLNQIDRLSYPELEVVRNDLAASLREDGIASPRIFPLAADPARSAPIGIDAFTSYLEQRLDTKRVANAKVAADIRHAGRLLRSAGRLDKGTGLGFDERWEDVSRAVAGSLVGDPGSGEPGGFEEELCRLDDFITAVSVETGGSFGARLRRDFGDDVVSAILEEALTAAGVETPATPHLDEGFARFRRWLREFWFGPEGPATAEERAALAGRVGAELEQRLGAPLRARLWERAELASILTLVEIESAPGPRGR